MYNQFFTIKPRISEKKRRKQSCTPNTIDNSVNYAIKYFSILKRTHRWNYSIIKLCIIKLCVDTHFLEKTIFTHSVDQTDIHLLIIIGDKYCWSRHPYETANLCYKTCVQQNNLTAKHVVTCRFYVEKNFYITLMQNLTWSSSLPHIDVSSRRTYALLSVKLKSSTEKNALLLVLCRILTNTCW